MFPLKKSWVNLRKYFQIGTILKKVYAIASFPILVVVFQLEFVSIAWVINHMTYYNFQCSPWLKIHFKNPLMQMDFLSSLNYASEFVLVSTIETDIGMKVSVAGVKYVREFESMPITDLPDLLQNLRKMNTRYYGVMHVEIRRQPTVGAESQPAGLDNLTILDNTLPEVYRMKLAVMGF